MGNKLKGERKAVSIDPATFSKDSETVTLEQTAAAPVESSLKGEGMAKPDTRTGKPKTAKPPKVRDHFILLSPSSPLDSASRFLSEHCTQEGVRTLHYHRGDFYAYTGTHYRTAENQEIRTQLYDFLKQAKRLTKEGAYVPFEPNQPKVSHVMDALKAASFVSSEIDLPVWLDDSNIPADEILACKNGLLHLPTQGLIEHTPAFFGYESLPFDYDPEAGAPTQWLKFLTQLWPDDPASIKTLQEWFGYCLSADTRQQKILLIVGPKRSGKGTIGRIQRKLLGSGNVCGPTLSDLTQHFGLEPLINKRLAVISDARLGGGTNQSVMIERLLSISGEDAITVHRKHKTAWTGALPTKLMILTNELPEIQDSSGAAVSRLIVLKLTKSFLGQEDTTLTDRLSTDLPGILNWALYGLKQLQKRGHFRQPGSAKGAIEQLEDLGSPVSEFIKDKCKLGPEFSVSTAQLFKAWKQWCGSQGIKPSPMSLFGRALSSCSPSIEKSRPRDGKLKPRKNVYKGIKLNAR